MHSERHGALSTAPSTLIGTVHFQWHRALSMAPCTFMHGTGHFHCTSSMYGACWCHWATASCYPITVVLGLDHTFLPLHNTISLWHSSVHCSTMPLQCDTPPFSATWAASVCYGPFHWAKVPFIFTRCRCTLPWATTVLDQLRRCGWAPIAVRYSEYNLDGWCVCL